MSIAEILLVIGTFGICTGVWVTLLVIIQQHKINQLDKRKQMAETAVLLGRSTVTS